MMHAALEAVRERPLAAPAGVDLRLHDDRSSPSSRAICFRFFRRVGDLSAGGGDAEFLQQFFRLVFVNVHAGCAVSLSVRSAGAAIEFLGARALCSHPFVQGALEHRERLLFPRRRKGRIQVGQIFFAEPQLCRGGVGPNVIRIGSFRNCDHLRLAQNPGQRDLRRRSRRGAAQSRASAGCCNKSPP